MSTNHYPDDVTKLEMVLALLQKTGKSEAQTAVHAMSIRIPLFDYANIEAMAQHSGLSRNKVISQLLDLALTEVWSGLDDENAQAINELRMRIYCDMTGEHMQGITTLPQAQPGEV